MDYGTVQNNITPLISATTRRVSILALTTCVGLLAGVSSAADSTKTPSRTPIAQNDANHTSNLIVRVTDAAAFRRLVSATSRVYAGVALGDALDNEGQIFIVHTPNLAIASKVLKILGSNPIVTSASYHRPFNNMNFFNGSAFNTRSNASGAGSVGIGIRPVPSSIQPPRGGSGDPQFANQWHLVNGLGGVNAIDNNVTNNIFDVMGYTGAGVVIGVPAPGQNVHIDTDHADLVNNYSLALSQEFDPVLFPDDTIVTGWAGIAAAERDNGAAGRGVAPGATLATFQWSTGIPLIEFEAYEWLNQDVDIKFYYTLFDYVTPQGIYNNGHIIDYVIDPLENSIRFGRNGKGVVNIYGTGTMMNLGTPIFLPDPYNFPPSGIFSPVDEWANGNEVSDGLLNAFSSGPYYITGNTNNYPPANDRRSLVINSVASDGNYDIYAGQGASVFASVYAGTNNLDQITDPLNFPLPLITTTPGASGDFANLPTSAGNAVASAITTAPAVTSGIVALMLEANPKLSIRDIQHIFFESIQESPKDPTIKWPNFDVSRAYYFPDAPGVQRGFWQVNSGLYNGGPITNQAIRHSDNYGFGVIDTELAVTKAIDWPGSPPLHLLDTGVRGDTTLAGMTVIEDFRVPVEIPDATWLELSPVDGATGTDGFSGLVLNGGNGFQFCVRQNVSIESVIIDLTIEGSGSNDLFIVLTSPSGTRSILAMPQSLNGVGTADPDNFQDDEFDQGFSSGFINGDEYAYFQHPFLSWKHWGEKAGGVWNLSITDYGPDAITPEGAEAGDDPLTDPGADMITGLGEIGVPGSEYRSTKTLTAFRVRIYGTDTGLPIFEGCDPFTTSCPADLNGDGIINVADLQLYLNWFMEGNALADLDGDGDIDYSDLVLYRGIWQPGFCNADADPFNGGRPRPGGGNLGGDNDPFIDPI